jgi:hypothetical protein
MNRIGNSNRTRAARLAAMSLSAAALLATGPAGAAQQQDGAPDGVVYVNTWSGRFYGNTPPHPGGFLVALRDTTGNGKADVVTRFGPDAKSGNAGGTGIALYNGALYAETNDSIVRYTLPPGRIVPTAPPEVIVSGLPLTGDHPMHPFAIDAQGALYVDSSSATQSNDVTSSEATASVTVDADLPAPEPGPWDGFRRSVADAATASCFDSHALAHQEFVADGLLRLPFLVQAATDGTCR